MIVKLKPEIKKLYSMNSEPHPFQRPAVFHSHTFSVSGGLRRETLWYLLSREEKNLLVNIHWGDHTEQFMYPKTGEMLLLFD